MADRSSWVRLVSRVCKPKACVVLISRIVSYADLIFVSMLHFLKRAHEDVYTKLVALDDALSKVYEASKQWLEREN